MDSPEESHGFQQGDDIDKPFSFRSADEVLRDDAVDSNAATLEDVDNGLSSNGLPRCSIAEWHLTSLSFMRNSFKKWIEDVVEPVVVALQEEGEDLRRCRQHAIELEENKLVRKRQMILMKKRRAGRWSPTRRAAGSTNSLRRSIRRHHRNASPLRYLI